MILGGIWYFPKIRGTLWGPHSKASSILGSILGSPYFGKLPVRASGLGLRTHSCGIWTWAYKFRAQG